MSENAERSLVVYHSDSHIVTWRGQEGFRVAPAAGSLSNMQVGQFIRQADANVDEIEDEEGNFICPLCGQFVSSGVFMTRNYFRCLSNGHGRGSVDVEGEADLDIDIDVDLPDVVDKLLLNNGYYKSFFIENSRLGSGGFASVFQVEHVLNGVELGTYAVKTIPVGDSKEWLTKSLREASALCRLRSHPNVITYHHSWLELSKPHDFGPMVICLYLLMDYANSSSLDDFIFSPSDFISNEDIWRHFTELSSGMRFLHTMGIIHRDLKPQNLLFNREWDPSLNREVSRLLIGDFGLCQMKELMEVRDGDGARERTGASGTISYMAPELLAKDSNGCYTGEASESSDVWSMGVILYCMMYKSLPWDDGNCIMPPGFQFSDEEIDDEIRQTAAKIVGYEEIVLPVHPPRPQPLKQLVQLMLDRDPSRRPTVQDIQSSMALRYGAGVSECDVGVGVEEERPAQAEQKQHYSLIATLLVILEIIFQNAMLFESISSYGDGTSTASTDASMTMSITFMWISVLSSLITTILGFSVLHLFRDGQTLRNHVILSRLLIAMMWLVPFMIFYIYVYNLHHVVYGIGSFVLCFCLYYVAS